MPQIPADQFCPISKEACLDRCAEFGDPPCYDVEPGCAPCIQCLGEALFTFTPPPPDPRAAVRDMFA